MWSVSASPAVPGPDPPTVGFIADFLREIATTDENWLKHGDVFDLPLSSPGYSIPPVTVTAEPEAYTEGDLTPTCDQFLATVVLVPDVSQPQPTDINRHIFEVQGLATKTSPSLSFTLSPSDPHSDFISHDPATGSISLQINMDLWMGGTDNGSAIFLSDLPDPSTGKDTSFMKEKWREYEHMPSPEGVVYLDDTVPESLVHDLNNQIDELAANEVVDWHPGSGDCVRDLVHPSMYPFVKGESPLTREDETVVEQIANRAADSRVSDKPPTDRWGRLFEDSIYQWLPAVFSVAQDGSVSINSYINNLNRNNYAPLYTSLGHLFEHFVPLFEQVYSYAQAVQFMSGEEIAEMEDPNITHPYNPDIARASLKGKSLRVITKIVEYRLRDHSAFVEGAFHVEGMSSEHIVATGSYTLSRDADIEGAALEMRRAFLEQEAWHIYWNVPQGRHWKADAIVDAGIRPIGRIETCEGRLIVFPNSHIHKLTRISCKKGAKDCSRRVIVFWLVDPDATVVTSEHVPNAAGGTHDEGEGVVAPPGADEGEEPNERKVQCGTEDSSVRTLSPPRVIIVYCLYAFRLWYKTEQNVEVKALRSNLRSRII